MATYASKLRKTAVDGQTIRLLPDGRIRGNAGIEPFSAGTLGGAPSIFYVDGNVVSSGNGLGWLSAFKTLAEGLVAAHAYMSTSGNRAWAQRATVYCCGDNLDEDLVLGAEKSDVIGVGTSTSFDRCILIGNHAPRTTTTQGMRWYNMHFDSDTAGILWSLTAISSGIKYLGCTFGGRDAAQTSAILGTACTWIEVADCKFETNTANFTTACFSIAAGAAVGLNIHNNFIKGSIGILINGSATAVGGSLLIDRNVIHTANETITDSSSLAVVTNNQLI
ncbi:hypothetical protein LCGC14_2448060, partial [marine sediment metagenome]